MATDVPALPNGGSADSAVESANREQIIRMVQFNLDGLGATNGHHRFEDLCRHFARERIAPNILPATGPVSAGGDGGRDFETFRSFMRDELGPHGAFAGALSNQSEAIAFICTLQRDGLPAKIRDDIDKIFAAGTPVSHVYAFLASPLPKAHRAKLQAYARERYGAPLEVIDGLALAELLVDREVFWIAEQFLSIPATMRLPGPEGDGSLPEWYVAGRERWRARREIRPTMGNLLNAVECLEYAIFHAEARVDLPFWIDLVRALDRDDTPASVRQRVRYHVAVAHARGIGEMRSVDHLARAFLLDVAENETDVARFEDAAGLLSYALAAASFSRSDIEYDELAALNDALRARLRTLLDEEPPRTRRAGLLGVLGHFAVMPNPTCFAERQDRPGSRDLDVPAMIDAGREGVPSETIATLPSIDIDEAMSAWTELGRLLESTPLYPVESWAQLLDFLRPRLAQQPGWKDIEYSVDAAIERIRGGEAVAERRRDRALELAADGRPLDALEEMHGAVERWWSGDHLRPAAVSLLFIANVYRHLKLPQAAKHYALAAALLGPSGGTNDLDDVTAHALVTASRIDYGEGDWASALEHIDVALTARAALVQPEGDPWAEDDFQYAFTTLAMCLRAADQLVPEFVETVEAVARRHGMLDSIRTALGEAKAVWSKDEWTRIADEQLSGRPFADIGSQRVFRFAALGTTWRIRSTSEYRAARAAERLAAATQIVLVQLVEDDLCVLPATLDVVVTLAAADESPAVVRDGSGGWRWTVSLHGLTPGQPFDVKDHFVETLGTIVQILMQVSLRDPQQCMEIVESAFKRGLGHQLVAGRPFEELAEIVTASRYATTPRELSPPFDEGPPPKEHAALAWRQEPGPTYSREAAEEALRRRYEQMPSIVAHTIARLRASNEFRATLAELRSRGWIDWHILSALVTIVGNERLMRAGLNTTDATRTESGREQAIGLMLQNDGPDDPVLPVSRFNVEEMEAVRQPWLVVYADTWDLRPNGPVSDTGALERFLGDRYGYWTDDVEHEDPFAV